MYSNFRIRIYNIPAFWLALVCLLVLLAIQETQQNDTSENAKNNQIPEKKNTEEEFPNLLQLIDATKRAHIVAETVHDGQRTQVEEYLDLSSYNQLVQYKWHEQTTNPHDDKLTTLRTRKFHSLLLNGRDKSIWYHYDQYRCFSADLNENSATSGDLKWTTSDGRSEPSLGAKQNGQQWRPWAGMSSPFLTQLIVKDAAAAGGSQTSRWVSGIAGLWLKIQEASAQEPAQEGNLNGVWRLELAGGIFADVYVEQMARLVGGGSDQGDGAVQYFDAPSLIVLKDKSQKQIQMINVFNIEFNYGNQLAKNLFKLPIGFGCPANSLLTSVATGVYFRDQRSQLMEFELVATRLDALTPVQQQTDVRNIELARARHPMDPEGSLLMFRSLEDRLRIVQDNSYKLEYKIYNLGLARQCGIEHLQFIEGAASKPGGRLASINSIPVELSNGITIDLSEFNMDYVLGLRESDTSHMRLLNVFDIDDSKSELVFEASVPSEHSQMVTLVTTANSTAGFELDSFGDELKLRMIRVYQQEVVKSSVYSKSKIRRGLLEFTRAIIFVFNADASEKLAEIRLNLLEDNHMMSFARRARLFDLSQCHDLEHESIELVVYYPAEPELLQTLSEQSHAILDSFYLSSFDWASKGIESVASGMMPQKTSDGVSDSNQLEVLRKKRLGASLNFLRVPKVELKLGATGELEMHLTILERISPLDLFEHLPNCCFIGDNLNDQTVLVGSLRECARQCLLFNCKVFDYDTGRQCKMSRLPLLVGPPINLASSSTTTSQKNTSGEGASAVELRPTFARLSEDHKCDLYYEPPFIADKHIGEASLAEISSYIEHIAEELDEFMLGESSSSSGDDDDNRPGAGFTIRHKRNVSPLRQPLFVLEFSDRSGQSSGYGPPKTWQLVPSELSIKRLPGVLDVRALAQASRVDHTFGVKAVGRAYNLSALDPPQPTSGTGLTSISANIRHPDERVFRDQHKQVYYTLKKISSISQENCALLCYDLEEFNYRKSGEQICESFSYSKLDEVCILLIKTDFAFVDSILDLVGEGELVLELESKDQLINVNFDGIVTARHYLGRFEGPLPLEENFVGARSTDPLLAVENGTSPVSELTLEWLPALVVEGSHVDDDQGEQCAERCASRNKHPDTGLCLAFDYCFTSNLLAAGVQSAGFSREIRRQQACNLLLVNNNNKELRSKTKLGQISWLRLHLTHATGSSEKATADTGELDTGEGHTKLTSCSRYLVSHLREFNHLNKRQLNKNSDLISKKLEVFSETVLHTDQNLCAMECGGLWAAECLLFEFCQHVTESRSIEQRCTLFKRTSHRNDADDDGSILKPVDNGTDSPTLVLDMAASSSRQSVTSYHDGCHVYLRREFETLEQALSDQALDKILTNQPPTTAGGGVFQHTVMTIWFVVIYSILATAFLTYCLVQRRNRLPKTTTASDSRQLGGSSRRQAPISMIMMEEINNSRARI